MATILYMLLEPIALILWSEAGNCFYIGPVPSIPLKSICLPRHQIYELLPTSRA